jgi:hypothetical protein
VEPGASHPRQIDKIAPNVYQIPGFVAFGRHSLVDLENLPVVPVLFLLCEDLQHPPRRATAAERNGKLFAGSNAAAGQLADISGCIKRNSFSVGGYSGHVRSGPPFRGHAFLSKTHFPKLGCHGIDFNKKLSV